MIDVYVIVTIHNESGRIEALLDSLAVQTYKDFRFVILDDGSTDNSAEVISKISKMYGFTDTFTSYNYIRYDWRGKDRCLKEYISSIAGDALVIATDADCTVKPGWVESIVEEYRKENPAMLISPVVIDRKWPIQATEFLSIQAVTLISAVLDHPVMCGGANLAFTTAALKKALPLMPEDIPNGSDMFLLEAMKKNHEKITANTSSEAIVTTTGCGSLKEFFRQRGRWAGKANHYTNIGIIISAATVLTIQVIMVAALVLSFFNTDFLILWVIKILFDLLLLSWTANNLEQTRLILYIPLVSIIYPFYVLATVTYSIFNKIFRRKR